MRSISLLITALLALLPTVAQPPNNAATYAALRTQAEQHYAEKSFARAHALYAEASRAIPPGEARWVRFRLADTSWRADAANPSADTTVRDTARGALEELIRESGADRDRIVAEANESLGDLHWTDPRMRNLSAAQPYYLAALDWWAGSDDLSLARRRYLGIVFRMSDDETGRHYGGGYYRHGLVPRQILVNAVAIAESLDDRVRASFLLGTSLLSDGSLQSVERGLELLEVVIAEGKGTAYYDDALFVAAQRLAAGVVVVEDGRAITRPDFVRALTLYRRITREFSRGETPYYDESASAIEQITAPSVVLMVAGTFLPASEQEVVLSWRNVADVAFSITPVDLLRDVALSDSGRSDWQQLIRTEGRTPLRRWTVKTGDRGDHVPGNERIRIAPKLARGAYVIEASSGGSSARQLILVTDINVLVHSAGERSDVFVSDATTGRPIAGARVRAWQQTGGRSTFTSQEGRTNADGLTSIRIDGSRGRQSLVFASGPGDAQAFVSTWTGYYGTDAASWRVYAFTDRPAYRPEETVRWKFIARANVNDRLSTPAGQELDYEIVGPRGEKVAEGRAKLNEFGTFWSDLQLTPSMALGSYTIQLRRIESGAKRDVVGHAELFRLEEYKLPEFRVTVTTPFIEGNPIPFRLGETVEATIEAAYYFGGPVANATVEAVIYSRPFARYWPMSRDYAWYWDRPDSGYRQELRRETLTTDASGRAVVRIETSRDQADTELMIEARVTDASRREVSGQGSVRVTRQRYSVVARPHRHIVAPGEQAGVELQALDANDQPVSTTGDVRIVRRQWEEIWIDPVGREVSGAELERLRSAPGFNPGRDPAWRRKVATYREEEILKTTVTTDANGEATLTFRPSRAGYYAIYWSSEDRDPGRPAAARDLVTAETTIWVTDRSTIELGYRSGGLEIVVDRDSFRSGQTASAMIVTPASGRWVVLTASAGSILDTQVIRLDGTVKLVQFPLDERHVPSFHLTASSVFDRMLATTNRQLIVPPVEHFVDVEVKSETEEYQPRDQATIVVTTRDVDGKPVSAEVALSVSDEAVTAIARDPAGDPRQFFFGQLRPHVVQVAASVQSQRYLMLVAYEKELVDEREIEERRKRDGVFAERDMDQSLGRGFVGGVAGGVPAPPSAPMPASAVAQARSESLMASDVMNKSSAATEAIDVQVRSDFRSTAFWQPDVITNADGTARVTFPLPEALTTWRATARATTTETKVGMGSSTMRTTMPLLVRLQAPRFLVAGDRATISAVINNNTGSAMRVVPSLEVEGVGLIGTGSGGAIEVPANGEARADWSVDAKVAGRARLRVTARGSAHSDAMERSIPVFEHGIDKLVAHSGALRGDEAVVKLELPGQRRATDVTVRIQPSLAVTMLDALPYLIDFPYGCTEQTMSRFLPAAIVARTLTTSGLAAREIEGRLFGGIEQQHLATTHPQGEKGLPRLDRVTTESMKRLYDFQHSDGGWGWWKEGASDDFMTAYVVWGFAIAKEARLAVDTNAVNRAVSYLDLRLVQHETSPHQQAWMLHAIAAWRTANDRGAAITANQKRAFDNVWTRRERLTAYSRALLALAAHDLGNAERAAVLIRNLEDGVKIDRSPDRSVLLRGSGRNAAETMATARWGEEGFWWRWHDGPVESTAFVLRALVRIDPENKLIEPAMNWLVKNRRGAQWNNTRDTAVTVLALNEYLVVSGELSSDVAYEVSVNGRVIDSKRITRATVLSEPGSIHVDESLVLDSNEIRIRRTSGSGALYFSVEGRFFSLEEPVAAAGNELFVRRDYFRLVPRPTLLKGVSYERVPVRDRGAVRSGERVEVVLTIETKNAYDYLLFEDLKPAGLEAVALQSGEPLRANELRSVSADRKFAAGDPAGERPAVVQRPDAAERTGRAVAVYQELRDRHVALFIDHLPQGIWEIRYTLRAEVPGTFHALPLLGQAMYVPEIRANGEEVRMVVEDGPIHE